MKIRSLLIAASIAFTSHCCSQNVPEGNVDIPKRDIYHHEDFKILGNDTLSLIYLNEIKKTEDLVEKRKNDFRESGENLIEASEILLELFKNYRSPDEILKDYHDNKNSPKKSPKEPPPSSRPSMKSINRAMGFDDVRYLVA